MSENWSRRTILASLGTATFSGCVSDEAKGTQQPTSRSYPKPPESIDSEWPMPAHDAGLSNGTSQVTGPTESVAELWQVATGTTLSGPVVANEILFTGGSDGTVFAFDAQTGQERWQQSVGSTAFTPWAVNDSLVVPTETAIVVLDASDGTEKWRVETPSRDDNTNKAGKVERPTILVASHGVYWISNGENPVVVSLALEDGSEQWRTEIHDPWTRRLFASEEAVFISTSDNGRVPWTLAAETGEVLDKPAEPGADFKDERFYRDGTIYAVDQMFGTIQASAADDNGHSWDQALSPGIYALSGDKQRVYINVSDGEEPGLYALSVTDGTVEWSTELTSEHVNRPVVAGESVLVDADDKLHCFDPADGTERWTRPSDDIGEHIITDDLAYTTHDDTVRAFR